MTKGTWQVAILLGLTLALLAPPLALAQITQVQMGVDGMI